MDDERIERVARELVGLAERERSVRDDLATLSVELAAAVDARPGRGPGSTNNGLPMCSTEIAWQPRSRPLERRAIGSGRPMIGPARQRSPTSRHDSAWSPSGKGCSSSSQGSGISASVPSAASRWQRVTRVPETTPGDDEDDRRRSSRRCAPARRAPRSSGHSPRSVSGGRRSARRRTCRHPVGWRISGGAITSSGRQTRSPSRSTRRFARAWRASRSRSATCGRRSRTRGASSRNSRR